MSFATAERDIEQRLIDNWPTTPIDINPNVDFTPPAADIVWVKLRVEDREVNRVNIGLTNIHRAEGAITLSLFSPLGNGTRGTLGYADALAKIYRDQQFNGITCKGALVEFYGEYEGRWRTDVSVPFYWDGVY